MRFEEKKIKLSDGTICILRSPDENDAEQMIEYLKTTSNETHFMVRYGEEIRMTINEEKGILRECILSDKDIMIAAFIDGELVGNAGVNCFRNMIKLRHRAAFGISIKKKAWNKGIGNILVKQMIDEATNMGFEQIELGVFSDNVKAQNLYKKYGYEVWGTSKNAYKLNDGSYRDEIIMGRML